MIEVTKKIYVLLDIIFKTNVNRFKYEKNQCFPIQIVVIKISPYFKHFCFIFSAIRRQLLRNLAISVTLSRLTPILA